MASDGPSPHSPSLRLGLPAPQPSRRHHAQSLLGPSFYDPRTHHVLESHPERAAPLSRHDDERVTPSALTLSLHCASILRIGSLNNKLKQPAPQTRFLINQNAPQARFFHLKRMRRRRNTWNNTCCKQDFLTLS